MDGSTLPRRKKFWGCDSEYLSFGEKREDDVINIGFSDGHKRSCAYRSAEDAKAFLEERHFRLIYVWYLRAEFGTFASWKLLGVEEPTEAVNLKSQAIQRFNLLRNGGRKTIILDIQPFFKPLKWSDPETGRKLRLGKLENTAKFLSAYYGDPSLYKPMPLPSVAFGLRKPENEEEWKWYDERVKQDAKVTARAAEFLETILLKRFIPQPRLRKYRSWGTITKDYFHFPQMNVRIGREVQVKEFHLKIHELSEFAGRSEAFSTGALKPPIYYCDLASLYPVSVVTSDCLLIKDVEPLTQSELDGISKPDDYEPYCWLFGVFETENDLWGLPVRSMKRNYYIVGRAMGLFHTLDLKASKAEILTLCWGLKPIFDMRRRPLQARYAALTMQKLEGRYEDLLERYGIKELVNDTLGKFGQSKPQPASTTNFPLYSTGLAMSHKIMSKVFDIVPKPIHYMDTDSAFLEKKVEGELFSLESPLTKTSAPVIIEVRAIGDVNPMIFRSKHYYLNDNTYTTHAIQFERSDWLRVVRELPSQATLKRQIRGTIRTRSRKAKDLQFGRWYYETLEARSDCLGEYFHADDKRVRETYDSYGLCRKGACIGSRGLTDREFYEQKMKDEDLIRSLPSGKKHTKEFVRRWLRDYAQSQQAVDLHEACVRVFDE